MLKKFLLVGVAVVSALAFTPWSLGAVSPNDVYVPIITTTNESFSAGELSANGRYVLYGTDNRVYMHDLQQNTAVSIPSNPTTTIRVGGISVDGRFVAYGETNPAVSDPDPGIGFHVDGKLLDRQTNQVVLVDAVPGGYANDSGFGEVSITDDGHYVVFRSNARNLVAGTTGTCGFYIRDIWAGVTDCVSRSFSTTNGIERVINARISGNGQQVLVRTASGQLYNQNVATGARQIVRNSEVAFSDDLSISPDGRYVGYLKEVSGNAQVFRFDSQTGTSVLASQSTGGLMANNGSLSPRVSGDGRYVTFRSFANNLLDGAPTVGDEVFVHDFTNNTTIRVASSGGGAPANGGSAEPSISADGSVIVFSFTRFNGPEQPNLSPMVGTVNGWRGLFARMPEPAVVVPDAPTGLQAASSPTNIEPHLTWNSSALATSYNVYRDASLIGSTSNTSFSDTSATDGSHDYYVTATSSGGESSPSNTVAVVVDMTSPSLTSPTWSSNPLAVGGNTQLGVTVSDSGTGLAQVDYAIDGGPLQALTFNASLGVWQATFGATLAAGTYNVDVIATDLAGNVASVSDVLVVFTTSSVRGHAKLLPTASDVMPIALDTSNNPAKLGLGFTNITAPVSGSFDIDYTVKNKKNEFALASTSIDWVVVPDSTHASIMGHATLTTYVDGVMTVTPNMPVRIDIVLGANGNADVTIQVYDANSNPATTQPLYVISEPIIVNGSNLQIN